ncbi:MAG: A/G-specific adenine glycosylase [Butyricicoccaceae bacterium]
MDELLEHIPEPLLSWYDSAARVLPWRSQPTPYRVWISEIMLQQTRVEAVKPYFDRFLSTFPTVRALADAPEETVLKLWEGLGYYSRARNLHKAAKMICEEYGGVLPDTKEELLRLPGIGSYTAGAIASIAFNKKLPAVDGNVLRVISRVLASRQDIAAAEVKKAMEHKIQRIIPDRAGDFNQSLMELGATVCLPNGAPLCGVCPLSHLCRAQLEGLQGEIPVKAPKKPRKIEQRTVFVLWNDGRMAIRRRPKKGLLAGLWELPNCPKEEQESALREWGITPGQTELLGAAKHIFTHIEWHMQGMRVQTDEIPDLTWVTPEELAQQYTLPNAFRAFLPKTE